MKAFRSDSKETLQEEKEVIKTLQLDVPFSLI